MFYSLRKALRLCVIPCHHDKIPHRTTRLGERFLSNHDFMGFYFIMARKAWWPSSSIHGSGSIWPGGLHMTSTAQKQRQTQPSRPVFVTCFCQIETPSPRCSAASPDNSSYGPSTQTCDPLGVTSHPNGDSFLCHSALLGVCVNCSEYEKHWYIGFLFKGSSKSLK